MDQEKLNFQVIKLIEKINRTKFKKLEFLVASLEKEKVMTKEKIEKAFRLVD